MSNPDFDFRYSFTFVDNAIAMVTNAFLPKRISSRPRMFELNVEVEASSKNEAVRKMRKILKHIESEP